MNPLKCKGKVIQFSDIYNDRYGIYIRKFYMALYDYLLEIEYVSNKNEFYGYVESNQNKIRWFLKQLGIIK